MRLRISHLAQLGYLSARAQNVWEGIRRLRNSATHPETQQIWGIAQAVQIAEAVAEAISTLPWGGTEAVSRRLGFLIPLIFSDFFGDAPTREALQELIGQLPWTYVVMLSAGISAISWQFGVEDPQHQAQLVKEFTSQLLYGPALLRRLQSDSKALLFTRESLFAVLKLAVVGGSDGSADPSQASDIFTKAILMANELLGEEISPVEFTRGPTDLLATELRSRPLQLENPHDLIARTNAFLEWSRSADAIASNNYLPIDVDFQRFTQLTPLEYMAAAYALLSRCSAMQRWDDVERMGVAFTFDQWQHGVPDTRVTRTWIDQNSVPVSTLREDWHKERSLSFAGAGPLWSKPVGLSDDGLYFVPSPALVTNKLGDGIYFALFDAYRNEGNENHLRFSRFWSEFFERYVAQLLSNGYANRTDATVFTDHEYELGRRSTDVIITEGNDVLFIEVVAKRPNLLASVLRLDDLTIAKDLEHGIAGKARQLEQNIRSFRAGRLLPHVPRTEGQRIFPIIVAPQEWPRVNVITGLLKNLADDDRILVDTEPVELLDIGEIEMIERGLQDGLSLSQLLDRKNRTTPHNRFQSLHNYLLNIEPGTLPKGMTLTRQRGSEVAHQILELAKTWTQPKSLQPE
ncbi:MAG: hypothetical protein ABSE64_08060 [Vulcanimicrobiaceae bacterium]